MAVDHLAGLPAALRERLLAAPSREYVAPVQVTLSDEQQAVLDAVAAGENVIVDACIGAGKTSTIQRLCSTEAAKGRSILYLTYSKLLKQDAQARVTGAKVQNYHGIVYPWLLRARIKTGLSESISRFNQGFERIHAKVFPVYDMVVIDEYQDITEEYAALLRNIVSLNPGMQVVLVGDFEQKLRDDTAIDVQGFAREIAPAAVQLPFTQSFRMGPQMAELLGKAWGKPIVGANASQTVEQMSFDEAVRLIGGTEPSDLLVLGKRNGRMSEALNQVERGFSSRYNKNTVYASIRDSDDRGGYSDDTAVFTTFDSSKGLEREVCVIFDFDVKNWQMRNSFPGADPVTLRNTFLVAASRGKGRIVFVDTPTSQTAIGAIPIDRFTHLSEVHPPQFTRDLWVSEAFDFKYAENVEACFALLRVERLDDGQGETIDIERHDGLIDLSPAVGHYQEALFFEGYDPTHEVLGNPKSIAQILSDELGEDPWRNSLLLTAVDTDQMRYAEQVTARIPEAARAQLVERLSQLLDPDCQAQVPFRMEGFARPLTKSGRASRVGGSTMHFAGVADAVQDDIVYELKFVTELTHPMFLQLAMYLVMSGKKAGVLWNTRTDERWLVGVPQRKAFLHAVARCVSKQAYGAYELEGAMELAA